jgi:hypothetical protein
MRYPNTIETVITQPVRISGNPRLDADLQYASLHIDDDGLGGARFTITLPHDVERDAITANRRGLVECHGYYCLTLAGHISLGVRTEQVREGRLAVPVLNVCKSRGPTRMAEQRSAIDCLDPSRALHDGRVVTVPAQSTSPLRYHPPLTAAAVASGLFQPCITLAPRTPTDPHLTDRNSWGSSHGLNFANLRHGDCQPHPL